MKKTLFIAFLSVLLAAPVASAKGTAKGTTSAPNKDGLHQEFFDNGKVRSEINYRNGVKDGLVRTYYENGQLKISKICSIHTLLVSFFSLH